MEYPKFYKQVIDIENSFNSDIAQFFYNIAQQEFETLNRYQTVLGILENHSTIPNTDIAISELREIMSDEINHAMRAKRVAELFNEVKENEE